MKRLETLRTAVDMKYLQATGRMKNRIEKALSRKDPGINELLIEMGLIIVGVTLLVFFTTEMKPIMKDFLGNCKEKALAIFNMSAS